MSNSSSILGKLVILTALSTLAAVAQDGTNRGWWPRPYNVQRDDAAGKLVLSTPYYTIEHDLKKGGTLSKIALAHGRAKNLLVQPVDSSIQLSSPEGRPASERDAPTANTYTDLYDASPSVSHSKDGDTEVVTVRASLLNKSGESSGVSVSTTYHYRWGYIKIHKEFQFPETKRTRNVCALNTVLDPSLTDYGYRPNVRELMDPELFSWRAGQIRQWGKLRAGTHFDLPVQIRMLPRYFVFANPGVEGIEWFMSDDLYQWDYQMTGVPGTGWADARTSTDPLGVAVSIYPVMLSSRYELPKGGAVNLKGSYAFDYYIGFPILEGHAYNPWLNRSYAVNQGKWVSEEEIKKNAADGVVTMHLHNDGDHHRDGLFWRDGSYPPYPPEEMTKMDAVIATIKKYGIKTVPYFSNHELHQSTEEFKQHGEEWGRIVEDQNNLRPNFYYGAHMCLKSGWYDFLKFSIDRVLKNHGFQGTYFDWHIAMFCNNPRHVGKTSNGVSGEKGLGAPSISETTHWDVDELVGLAEWTRQRVGPDGVMILHNTLVPMFATENFANYVVGMEFSYGRLSVSVPKPADVPLEWSFAGARPRTVIGYGTIAREAPKRLHRAHALLTLMTSVAPWPAGDEALDLYKALRPLGDMERYQFEDYRNQAVKVDNTEVMHAVYSRAGEAWVLLGNAQPEPASVRVSVNPAKLPNPLASVKKAEVIVGGKTASVKPAALSGAGHNVTAPADDVVLVHLTN